MLKHGKREDSPTALLAHRNITVTLTKILRGLLKVKRARVMFLGLRAAADQMLRGGGPVLRPDDVPMMLAHCIGMYSKEA
jgi:hypothetical protein